MNKLKTPLRIVVDVECSRRGWSFTEFARRLSVAIDKPVSKQSLSTRIDHEVPTRKTVGIVADIFNLDYAGVLARMREEVALARHEGRDIAPAMAVVPLEETQHEE